MTLRFLSAKLAQQIDEELMSAHGAFSIDQLMELAGLSCAQALAAVYPARTHPRVLVCCGPGNQGGDGLVAARHLSMFGYKPTIYMPKPGKKDIYERLHKQTRNLEISTLPISDSTDSLTSHLARSTDVILDAIFGFSFHPPVRAPFDRVLPLLSRSKLPIVSVDIPSGWDVEKGPILLETEKHDKEENSDEKIECLMPEVLVSLTAPKEGVRAFRGRHFLGGRFVSSELEKKFELNLPAYLGVDQIIDITHLSGSGDSKI
jgi:NAD(P)H-hydrate epimerase